MKKVYISLLSLASMGVLAPLSAVDTNQVPVQVHQTATSSFTQDQVSEIEKLVGDYISKNPEVVMMSIQAGMEQKEKEDVAKMELAVVANKEKIFNDSTSPIIGNPKGTQSLVVFLDPYCGYCKKFHKELVNLLSTNKDVKVIVKEIPIMGDDSVTTIKALLAAKNQGKYEQLQAAVYSSDKHLDNKQMLKIASSLGIDTKKLEADMKDPSIQKEIDQTLELAKDLGVNGTPTLIIGEKTVIPGFMTADQLNKKLKEEGALGSKGDSGRAS